ncbi:hydrogen gas-evolving membrane-bound hydrogenase subunit E [Amycolatopsis sp. CA-230715]|uniref:hydrogen gas-evolving membrane-bound hydrogenase subunit E n=1 Tax=Amycolatopsis sp. CA-230715 TaxID=2745196 RepID=UPI001C0173FD|nr:hydrogen gas-evolving membrane-bound hydrogenase subunit E [Amycolatopsis sp. CA-230715]
MLVAIVAHFAVAAALPAIAKRWGRNAFYVAALIPAASLVFALNRLGGVLDGAAPQESLAWAPGIGLEISLRMDPLALLMIVLVSGVGALVLCYSARYAKPGGEGITRESVLLLVFAGAMLGLVLADDIFSLYLFWELTTVCSFLLVGGRGLTPAIRRSATQALLVTGFGGLTMLLGLILLATAAGTYRISEIIAHPPGGAVTSVAVVLVLVGALTKSAQVPFHPWLPAAMVAPTPVSAYLHAAAMVKAGVYLVARFAPGFSDLTAWWVPVVVLGLWTMLLGGLRALREHDLKRLLAFGTVSQLGFLMVLVGSGGFVTALAGATLILAHGLFKSALFLTVGVLDKATGTRDIRELSGIGRRWPVLTAFVVLAAASMAGFPPLLGFVGKETAFTAFGSGSARDTVVLVCLVLGSVLTFAYSLRFVIGGFGTPQGKAPIAATWPGQGLVVPMAIPATAGLVCAFAVPWLEPLLAGYADAYPGHDYHLALWHGFTVPLGLSALVVLGGYLVHRGVQRAGLPVVRWPKYADAQAGYRGAVRALDALARRVTGRLQVGSLPVYLGVILLTAIVVPGAGLLAGVATPGPLRLWDSPMQVPIAILVLVATATVLLARRRLTAVLLTGVIGYGIGALFLVDGGPDLALAQFLVESLTLVVFVFVLRRLPERFVQDDRPPGKRARWTKAVIAVAGGIFVAALAMIVSASRDGLPDVSREYIERAQPAAGASNVVNAIIVDFRAFDTVGEIAVLAVAATGAASLILGAHRARRRPEREETEEVTE